MISDKIRVGGLGFNYCDHCGAKMELSKEKSGPANMEIKENENE